MLAAYDRSRGTNWEGAHGMVLPEVDPTDETALDAQKERQPERRLLLAILADAIVRCRQLATAPRYASIELREAERWIKSDDRSWPCSFVNVCDALDIAYTPLRRAVLSWRCKTEGGPITRRALLVKKRRRKRFAVAVAACASADAPDSGAAVPASSASSDPPAPSPTPSAKAVPPAGTETPPTVASA